MRGSKFVVAVAAVLVAYAVIQVKITRAQDAPERPLFIDVHHLGAGNVTAEAVADAHQKDLAVQDRLDVEFERYWVDEEMGDVYCLSRARAPEDVVETHRRAHGLLPDTVYPVVAGSESPATRVDPLFLDVHRLGPGNVTTSAVAEAHEKDIAVEGGFDVNFLDYWVDEQSGTVFCLSEAPSAEAVNAVHGAAHGLLADEVYAVAEGH